VRPWQGCCGISASAFWPGHARTVASSSGCSPRRLPAQSSSWRLRDKVRSLRWLPNVRLRRPGRASSRHTFLTLLLATVAQRCGEFGPFKLTYAPASTQSGRPWSVADRERQTAAPPRALVESICPPLMCRPSCEIDGPRVLAAGRKPADSAVSRLACRCFFFPLDAIGMNGHDTASSPALPEIGGVPVFTRRQCRLPRASADQPLSTVIGGARRRQRPSRR